MRRLSVTIHEEFGASEDSQTCGYRIGGLPDGTTRQIFKGGDGSWKTRKVGMDGHKGEWSEPLPSFDAALDMVLSAYR